MASGSTMAGISISESRDNSLTPPPPEKATAGKATPRRTRQGATAKKPPSLPPANHEQTADQAFHDAPSEIIPDSQLQNVVADLERQVLEAKKAALQKQLQSLTAANPTPPTEAAPVTLGEARTSNFGLFYEHEGDESHLVPLIREYRSVDIQYIQDIKKNKFKPENIMKLSTSVRRTKEAAKNLKIGTSGLEIEAKEEDCTTTADAKGIIPILRAFHVYTQILIFLAAPGIKLQHQLALGKYAEHLMMLSEMYTWDSVCAYHFDFHQARILEGIDDLDHELKQYLLVPEIPTQVITKTATLEIRQLHQHKYASSGTLRKIVQATADCSINAPTVQATTQNAAVLPGLAQIIPTTPMQPQ